MERLFGGSEQTAVGLGYRTHLHGPLIRHRKEIDFIEVVADSFFRFPKHLKALSGFWPCVPHSVNLSLGSYFTNEYLSKLKDLIQLVNAPFHTDHLAYTRIREFSIGHLAPIPYTDEVLQIVADNIKKIQQTTGRPFAVENITMPFYWPNNTMEECDFICELVKKTGCGLLLDLENLRINCTNHGGSPTDFIDRLPLEHVMQIHVAGGMTKSGFEHDTHSHPVKEQTWRLLEYVSALGRPNSVVLERDGNFPDVRELLHELDRIKSIVDSVEK